MQFRLLHSVLQARTIGESKIFHKKSKPTLNLLFGLAMNTPLSLFPELDVPSYTTGILPSQSIKRLIRDRNVSAAMPFDDAQVQPASLDLRLGEIAYRVQASFLPGRHSTVESKLQELKINEVDLKTPCVFAKGDVYIVPLMEKLDLPSNTFAKANPKSTTGRLDIFTRLITDWGDKFEWVHEGYSGNLYCEIVPRTFPITVCKGLKLNQLRFRRGNPPPSDNKLREWHDKEPLVYDDEDVPVEPYISDGLRICVNLQGNGHSAVVGYRAKKNTPAIDLRKIHHYDPGNFWEPIYNQKGSSLILDPDEFYILSSKEKICVPPSFAAELVAFDPSFGEFRIHYAGFFDPGFGYGLNDIKGTQAVLEVRSREVPFMIEHGQMVGRLVYERLLEVPDRQYGVDIGSSYQSQGLTLSKQFKNFDPIRQ